MWYDAELIDYRDWGACTLVVVRRQVMHTAEVVVAKPYDNHVGCQTTAVVFLLGYVASSKGGSDVTNKKQPDGQLTVVVTHVETVAWCDLNQDGLEREVLRVHRVGEILPRCAVGEGLRPAIVVHNRAYAGHARLITCVHVTKETDSDAPAVRWTGKKDIIYL